MHRTNTGCHEKPPLLACQVIMKISGPKNSGDMAEKVEPEKYTHCTLSRAEEEESSYISSQVLEAMLTPKRSSLKPK